MQGVDPARRSRLLGLKLATLVREHLGTDGSVAPGIWPGGAALVRDGAAWVLAEDSPERSLGPALAWARQQSVGTVHLLAERDTGLLARRAVYFAERPTVWTVDERRLTPAVAEPFVAAAAIDAELEALAGLIVEGGAVPVREHGVLVGEVEGLEVCRAVRDEATGACRLEVGVGAHDREAFLLIHGNVPTAESLRRVVDAVVLHRRPDAEPHPLNRLGAERALRARIIREPSIVGAAELAVAPPPVPRANLKDAVPCVAAGRTEGGAPMVVGSTGIDLDLVPFAADARAALGTPDARLVIAVPPRDRAAVTVALAGALEHPAEVVGIERLQAF